ncbi:Scarecrow-like protein 32 [Raphanus sativus]|uniref:Scarecrow-like protein 32 n=1 Tax=Raphanus sativus TaxID=3726 RepID=A0A6J0JT86_RAPSA|nr:scarecrow-like protein 32 [Raphanus sativus]KAJ4890261.1 Scarecrow-like protein 32 [Raphanus sativus]
MTRTGIISPTRFPSFKSQRCSGGDASFMEQLLLHCATAIDSNDAALAHQLLWVLNNIAPPDADSSTQRLTSAFVRALLSRAASKIPALFSTVFGNSFFQPPPADEIHRFSVVDLAGFIDLTPWHRFGFIAANEAIITAVEGYSTVHIVDLSLTHCMQIPTLIDAMASKLNTPPLLKLTVVSSPSSFPPLINISYEELGSKLVNFATTRNIEMQFTIIPSTYSDGFSSLLQHLRIYSTSYNEALVVNCHMMLRYIPDETLTPLSLRNVFLNQLRSLNPTIVTLIEEDADLTSENLVARVRSAFNYFWIPFDTTDTFVSEQRRLYEAEVIWKIENVVAKEGVERVERTETKGRWLERMRDNEFGGVRVSEEAVSELKAMLGEHAVGWGMKKDDDDESLVLTWKGHSVVFATVWVPI